MLNKSCNCSTPTGISLVEVLGALALLAVLLVGVLAAHQRHAHQIGRARKTLEAATQVDALLYDWAENGSGPPRTARGDLPGNDLRWETHVIGRRHRTTLGIDVIRLTVYDKEDIASKADSADALISLELVVPAPQETS